MNVTDEIILVDISLLKITFPFDEMSHNGLNIGLRRNTICQCRNWNIMSHFVNGVSTTII